MRKNNGFTLIELLLALVISGVVMASLFVSMQVAFKTKKSIETAAEPLSRATICIDFMRKDFESALPSNGILIGTFTGTDGKGDDGNDDDDVTFFAAVDSSPQVALQTDVRKVEYTVIADGSDHVLVRRVVSNLLAPVALLPDDEVLCRGVTGFNLQYYDGTTWQDSWDSTQQSNAVPAAVKIVLDLAPAGSVKDSKSVHVEREVLLPCAVTLANTTGGGT